MALIFSILWILGFSTIPVYLFKQRFEKVAALSIICGGLFLYIFAFMGHLSYGYYFSWILIVLFIVYLFFNKNNRVEFINNFFCAGLVVFVLLVVYLYLLFRLKGFWHCDEFAHWGPMVRESFNNDTFYSLSDAIFRHKDYPPLYPLIETLFCLFGGTFKESYCFFGLAVFSFSLFLPLFSEFTFKDWFKSFIVLVGIIFVGLCISNTETMSDYAHFYNSVYVDWSLALFCAFGLFFVYKIKEWTMFEFVAMSLIGTAFLLMKQMGIFFYGLIVVYALLKLFFVDKRYDLKLIIKGIIFLAVIPLLFYGSWKLFIGIKEISGQFSVGSIKLGELVSILRGRAGEEWQREAFRNYRQAIFFRTLISHPFKMPYFVYLFIVSIALFFVCGKNRNSIMFSGTYLFFGLSYAGIMGLLYVFSFGSEEGPGLASFDRYMQSFLFIGTCLLFMLLVEWAKKKKDAYFVIPLLMVLVSVEWEDLNQLLIKNKVTYDNQFTVAVINMQYEENIFNRNEVNGMTANFIYYDADDEKELTVSEIVDNYNLIYIQTYNEHFYDNLWPMLSDSECYEHHLYSKEGERYNPNYSYMYYLLLFYTNNRTH